jgi:hypothetical protein
MRRLAWALRGLVVAGSLAGLPALSSVQAADFYQGKTLTVFVNFTPGGPTDVEARLLARHIGKHLAGNPTVIVKNMGGAGGVIGVNWLGQIAAPDGLTVGFFTGAASKTAMGDPGIQIDLRKFGFVAAGPGISVTYIRTDVPPGIKTAWGSICSESNIAMSRATPAPPKRALRSSARKSSSSTNPCRPIAPPSNRRW